MLGNLSAAFICGLVISYFYRHTYKGSNYSTSFVRSIIVLSMITAVVIMVIGNNLARAFGLVGSMSIIRFRTAIKDTQDIVFLFLSLAVGMAAGVGLYMIAFAGTLIIGMTLYVLSRIDYGSIHRQEFLVQFSFTSPNGEEKAYLPVFEEYSRSFNLLNVKSIREGAALDLSFYVRLKSQDKATEFVSQLTKVPGVKNVNFFFDEEQS